MGNVIYINQWRAKRRARPEPRGIVTVDLEMMCMTLEEYYAEDGELQRPIGTIEESLLRQIEAGEVPKK